MLISDPSGEKFDWSISLLEGTPFRSFLIPGIVLALSNGLFPLFAAVSILLKWKKAYLLIIAQGCITLGWLTVQLLFNSDFFVPAMHYSTYAVGLLLIFLGLLLIRLTKEKQLKP